MRFHSRTRDSQGVIDDDDGADCQIEAAIGETMRLIEELRLEINSLAQRVAARGDSRAASSPHRRPIEVS